MKMAYFAIEVFVERKVVYFLETDSNDQVYTDYKKGKLVVDRPREDDISDVRELTKEQFDNDEIPDGMK